MRLRIEDCKTEVVKIFKRHRKDFLGINQEQAGQLLGLSKSAICRYEKGKHQIPAYMYEYFKGLAPADIFDKYGEFRII